jgi:hypothetical protein
MGTMIFKEQLNGKYHGVVPATLMAPGGICDGKNMRKVFAAGEWRASSTGGAVIPNSGGWKARKGCVLNNTTVIANDPPATASCLSLHQYTHPRNGDYHFIAQCNGSLYDATNDPPAAGTTFAAAALTTLAGTTNSGFSDLVGETWLYADGDSAPVMWGGDNPYCTGFVVYDISETAYVDYTRAVTDNRTDTGAVVVGAATDVYYVCSPCIAKGLVLDLGTGVNTNAVTVVIKSWVAGAWDARTLGTDGTLDTATSTKTHAKDGTITWTTGADTMRVIGGMMGYWYQISWTGALSGSVDVLGCKVLYDPAVLSNKWSGVFETPAAVRFFDNGTGEYKNYTGELTNESTSQYLELTARTTSDFLYVKTIEPVTGIGFAIASGYEQIGNAQIDHVEYWNGATWTELGIAAGNDETLDVGGDSSFAQTGIVWWNATGLVVKRRTLSFDSVPGFWYRVSWDATLVGTGTTASARLFMVSVATFPEALPAYKGVVEFKGRALVWPDPEYPNRLRYSANGRPDCFSGSDSGYTDAFGDMTEIVCAKRFYNELIVWKKNSVWLLEGFSPDTFGTIKIADTVGCDAPKTAVVIETGYPTMHADEPMSVALWKDTDGMYVLDGRKPRKISLPVDQYFNTEFSTALAAASLGNIQAYVDRLNNEYHLLTQTTTELVYNFILDEWYPPWTRTVGTVTPTPAYLVCGIDLKGTDGRDYSYAGNNEGFVFRLESDTTDKNAANADVAIEQRLKTRAVSAEQKQSTTLEFTFRKAFIEAKARASGSIVTNFYKNVATAGTVLAVPAAISLVNTGYGLVTDGVDTSKEGCKTFQLEFVETVADVELEIYSFLYLLEIRGEFIV